MLARLRADGRRLVALTNWSAETFPIARARYDFLGWFEDIVVSGEVRLAKPDPRIFELTRTRTGLDPSTTLFIDDSAANIDAAATLGYHTHRFHSAELLEQDLAARGSAALIRQYHIHRAGTLSSPVFVALVPRGRVTACAALAWRGCWATTSRR